MAEVHSNIADHDIRFERAVEKALRLVGGQAERLAKETISDMKAVDTGFLRNSITFALAGQEANTGSYTDDAGEQEGEYEGRAPEDDHGKCRTVYIGTNVYYAPYVEYGTRKMGARPFLETSLNTGQEFLRDIFREAFEAFQ